MYLFIFIISFIFINKFNLKKTIKNNDNLDFLILQLNNNIDNIWGKNELILLKEKCYIKYLNNNNVRSYIDFSSKKVVIETIYKKNTKKYLKNAIINLLLKEELYKTKKNNFNFFLFKKKNKPFLYGKVLDNNGYPIYNKQEATEYANFLIEKKLNIRFSSNKKKIFSVVIKLNLNNYKKNYRNYINFIKESSIKYNIDYILILSIINIESNFDPYAISESGAIGLMQIIQNKSGIDVFKIQGKYGFPSKKYLFNPKNNIDIGTAYLYILQNNYLSNIKNPISLRYLTISSYNGGVKNVLKIFSNNCNNAINIINNMKPNLIYKYISKNHYSEEIKNYLIRVNKIYNYYKDNNIKI